MAKTQTASAWERFKNAEVSLTTGTLALATAAVAAYSVMPSPELASASLLEAAIYTADMAIN